VEHRIDEEDGGPRDVEELGADRVLDLTLLTLVDEGADEPDREQGQEGEGRRQFDAEALPGTERWPCEIPGRSDTPSR
jgi:hypothetical protein